MTRKEAKELLPIIQAFAEGGTVQYNDCGVWVNCADDSALLDTNIEPSRFRIKPESKYRPFLNQEECWEEMHKHPDFGWIVYDKIRHSICDVTPDEITILYECDSLGIDFKTGLERVTFTDGAPFGIKEE